MADPSSFLIVDDHPLFRDALTTSISIAWPEARCHEANGIERGLELLASGVRVDLTLLDLNLPGVNGFDGLLRIRSHHPRMPVLVVSGLDNEQIIEESIAYGAAGFLSKSLGRETLSNAIGTVLRGDVYVPRGDDTEPRSDPDAVQKRALVERMASLTPQQLRVLFMLREGLLNKQIAYELDVGATTVKKHVSEILRKLSVHSRTQAVIEAAKLDNDELFDLERRFLRDAR